MTLVERTDVRVTVQPKLYRQSVEHSHQVDSLNTRTCLLLPGRDTRIEATAIVLEALRWRSIGGKHQVCLAHLHTLPAVDKGRGR